MRETPDEIDALQRLLDDSLAAGGAHLRSVLDGQGVPATELVDLLTGMRLLVLATTAADGRPITGTVDGFFVHGRFHFGTAPDALRTRHLRRDPRVSATHVPGEHLQVVVHGTAEPVSVEGDLAASLTEQYGDVDWWREAPYFRIEPERMFTFRLG
ncbi:MAG: pyridoxamine 5'-phosphate oxidase family protein [Acidimicrobiia bacterium]